MNTIGAPSRSPTIISGQPEGSNPASVLAVKPDGQFCARRRSGRRRRVCGNLRGRQLGGIGRQDERGVTLASTLGAGPRPRSAAQAGSGAAAAGTSALTVGRSRNIGRFCAGRLRASRASPAVLVFLYALTSFPAGRRPRRIARSWRTRCARMIHGAGLEIEVGLGRARRGPGPADSSAVAVVRERVFGKHLVSQIQRQADDPGDQARR